SADDRLGERWRLRLPRTCLRESCQVDPRQTPAVARREQRGSFFQWVPPRGPDQREHDLLFAGREAVARWEQGRKAAGFRDRSVLWALRQAAEPEAVGGGSAILEAEVQDR